MKKLYLLVCGLCLLGFVSCTEVSMEGYAPVYESHDEYKKIHSEAPRSLVSPGKIYYKDNLIYVIERGEGIHVINNANPENPEVLHFIRLRGSSDISIRNNSLYSNNGKDLVVLDISDLTNVKEVGRVANAFEGDESFTSEEPPVKGVTYECADPAKGVVVKWVKKELTNPQCSN